MLSLNLVPMQDLVGITIIEHRSDETIVGEIDDCFAASDGTFSVEWHHGKFHRKVTFLPSCWDSEIVGGIIFLHRRAKQPPERELTNPWHDAELYTLVRTVR